MRVCQAMISDEDLDKLKKRFLEIFTDENWEKLEEEIKEIRREFYKQTELDDDAWDFVINE